MATSDVITILQGAQEVLSEIPLCQGAYALDSEGQPVAGLAGSLGEDLQGVDILGAIHRAASVAELLAFEGEARTAVADYLGYAQREDTSGTILRDWNDVSGRDAQAVSDLIGTVLAAL